MQVDTPADRSGPESEGDGLGCINQKVRVLRKPGPTCPEHERAREMVRANHVMIANQSSFA